MNQTTDYLHAYERMLQYHIKTSTGDRKMKLEQHGHAEKKFLELVWWPAFGFVEGLYPEYAVRDFKDGWRYLDYSFFTAGMKICIEIDGYGPHWRDITQQQFADNLTRQNHLMIDGWLVIRFAYDDVVEKPRHCQQILQQLLGKVSLVPKPAFAPLRPIEQAIVLIFLKTTEPLAPRTVAEKLNIHRNTAMRTMHALVEKELLVASNPSAKRVYKYTLNPAMIGQIRQVMSQ